MNAMRPTTRVLVSVVMTAITAVTMSPANRVLVAAVLALAAVHLLFFFAGRSPPADISVNWT